MSVRDVSSLHLSQTEAMTSYTPDDDVGCAEAEAHSKVALMDLDRLLVQAVVFVLKNKITQDQRNSPVKL